MASYSWNVSVSGDWSNSADWMGGIPSGSGATVTIAQAGTYTVAIAAAESYSVGSVTLNDATATLQIDGTLTVAGSLNLTAGKFYLDGTIAGGTIVAGPGAVTFAGGLLSGVTWQGPLTVGAGQTLDVSGGLTVTGAGGVGPGTIGVTGSISSAATIDVLDTETLNNATLTFSGTNDTLESAGSTIATLTLGSGFTLNQSAGYNYLYGGYSYSAGGFDSIVNNGAITVGAGTLEVDGAFTNNGTITVSGGTFDLAAAIVFGASGVLKTSGSGVFLLDPFGTLSGTINASAATFQFDGGYLGAATWEGALTVGPGQSLNIYSGLTLTGANGSGPGAINITGSIPYYSIVNVTDSETWNNATLTFGGTNGTLETSYGGYGSPVVLTFGANFTVIQTSGYNAISGTYNNGSPANNNGIFNKGTILVSGGTLEVGGTFTNTGTVTVSGGILSLEYSDFASLSASTLGGGSYEVDAGATIELDQNVKIVTDNTTLILKGAGSTVESLNTTTSVEIAIDSTLTTIGATGVLEILGGRNWTTTNAIGNAGSLILGGGVFTASSLTNATGASLSGYGTVAAAISNAGTVEASGGVLTLQSTVAGTGTLKIDAGATLALGGSVASTESVLFNGAGAILALSPAAGFTGSVSGLALTDEIDLVNTAANGVTLSAAGQLVVTNNGATVATLNVGRTNFDFSTVSDNNGGTLLVVSAEQAPVTTAPATLSALAGTPVALSGVSVADSDAVAYNETTTVVLSDATGLLSAIATAGATVTGAGTTSLTLSGSLAAVDAELSTLTYTGAAASGVLTDTIDVATNDGRGGSNDHKIVVAVDQPPVTTVPGSESFVAGAAAGIAGISVADPDAVSLGQTITVVVSDLTGVLSVTGVAGATVSGLGTNSLTVTGGLVAVDAALASLTYTSTGTQATDTITVATNDGAGGSNTHTIGISLDQPPMTTVPGPTNIVYGVTTSVAGISVADADAVSLGQTITVVITDTIGLLSATSVAGATVGGAGTTGLTLSGGLTAVDAELATLTYTAPISGAATNDTVTVATSDGAGGSNTQTIGVTLAQPLMTTAPTTLTAYTGTPAPIAGVSVSDGAAVGETITVVMSDQTGLLSATAATGATVSGSGTTKLTLTGSLAGVNAELVTLAYSGTLTGSAYSASDAITFTTTDGLGGTNTGTVSVKITHASPVVSAPSLINVLSGQATVLTGFTVTDSDALNASGNFSVLLYDNQGTLSAAAATGVTVVGAGTRQLTLYGSLAAIQAELLTVTYTGGPTGTRSILGDAVTFSVEDSHGGKASSSTKVNIGHLTQVTNVPTTQTVISGAVTPISGVSISDADPTAGSSVFTTIITDKLGFVSATAVGGGTVTGSGTKYLTLSGSLAQVNAELATLTYQDTLPGKSTSGSDTLTVTTSDGHGDKDSHTLGITITAPGPSKPSLALLIQYMAAFGGSSASQTSIEARVAETPHLLAGSHH